MPIQRITNIWCLRRYPLQQEFRHHTEAGILTWKRKLKEETRRAMQQNMSQRRRVSFSNRNGADNRSARKAAARRSSEPCIYWPY